MPDKDDERPCCEGAISRRALLRGVAAAALTPAVAATAALAGQRPAAEGSAAKEEGGGAAVAPAAPSRRGPRPRIAVIGAGAFGSFTALELQRSGAEVTLLDTWGPGNSRSSSGGETRVIRGVYGDRVYVEMVARAFTLWREHEARWKRKLLHPTGALWMVSQEGDFVRAAIPFLRELGFPFTELSAADAARRFPQIAFDGVQWALYEERAGYLLARQACAAAVEALVAEGGSYRELRALPGPIHGGAMDGLRLPGDATLQADAHVFACGPWLGELFPDVVGDRVLPTRQEVFFFGTPVADARFDEGKMPIWVDVGARLFYGIPGNEHRGFKVADDSRGPRFDPTSGDRRISPEGLAAARALLARRFPALRDAPLLESRVCQYENTPDHHLLLDLHPAAHNVWLVGGGSGHGFKLAPAWGERVAATVRGRRGVDPFFGLARLNKV